MGKLRRPVVTRPDSCLTATTRSSSPSVHGGNHIHPGEIPQLDYVVPCPAPSGLWYTVEGIDWNKYSLCVSFLQQHLIEWGPAPHSSSLSVECLVLNFRLKRDLMGGGLGKVSTTTNTTIRLLLCSPVSTLTF